MLTLKFRNESEPSRGLMYICDQSGAIRMQQYITVSDGMENRINLSQLEKGIYFIKVYSSELSFFDKFIIQ